MQRTYYTVEDTQNRFAFDRIFENFNDAVEFATEKAKEHKTSFLLIYNSYIKEFYNNGVFFKEKTLKQTFGVIDFKKGFSLIDNGSF